MRLRDEMRAREEQAGVLHSLLDSTGIVALLLDAQLRVRWFSPPAGEMLGLGPSDIGRTAADCADALDGSGLLQEASKVLESLQPHEQEVRTSGERWHRCRITPYRVQAGNAGGVLVTFTEITERKHWEERLAASNSFAERIVDTTRQPLVVVDPQLVVRSANRAFYDCFKLEAAQVIGRVLFEIADGDWKVETLRAALTSPVPEDGILSDLEISHSFRILGLRHLEVNVRELNDGLMLVAIEDVTERKRAEDLKEILLSELRHRVRNLLTKVSAVVSLSQIGHNSVPEYADRLQRRIAAIARTEELIGAETDDIELRALVEAETASVNAGTALEIEGPPLRLSPVAAQTVALTLHELATNAIKYGAFATPGASLRVGWSVSEEGGGRMLTFHWIERGVPIEGTVHKGFGSKLVTEVIPHMLGGLSELDMGGDGVRCTIRIPLASKISAPG
ncbi:MAG: PAS domain-containing protein [Alphaproteobacteria bacterium]